MSNMDFEKQADELLKKITELKNFAHAQGIDLSSEIEKLEQRSAVLLEEVTKNLTIWQKVQIARHKERPTTLDYIPLLFTNFIEFHGDRLFGDDPAIVGGVALFEGTPITIIGHQKGKNTKDNIYRRFGMPQPEGYRKALRLMKQAEKFKRPIITFINTAGAYPGKEAEERGQSEAIATNLKAMAGLSVPVICVVTGEGGSGGALALGVGNKIYMLENSFYSVISPEGAAALLWKDSNKAQQAAETMKIGAADLKELDVIDGIISEPLGGSHKNLQEQAENIKITLKNALKELSYLNETEIREDRYIKYRKIGSFHE